MPMYNMEDIFARLQKGEDPEAIAKEFTDALNSALEKQEKEERESTRLKELIDIVDLFADWLHHYYPELGPCEVDEEAIAKEIDDMMPDMVELIKSFQGLKEVFNKVNVTDTAPKKSAVDLDAVFNSFFNLNGI